MSDKLSMQEIADLYDYYRDPAVRAAYTAGYRAASQDAYSTVKKLKAAPRDVIHSKAWQAGYDGYWAQG